MIKYNIYLITFPLSLVLRVNYICCDKESINFLELYNLSHYSNNKIMHETTNLVFVWFDTHAIQVV